MGSEVLAVAFRPVIADAKGFAVLGNPVHLIWNLARPDLAPVFLALAGYGTQRATLKASMCIEAVEAKAALPSCSIVRAHARDPRTRIRYTPVHPAPALVCMSVRGSIAWHPIAALCAAMGVLFA